LHTSISLTIDEMYSRLRQVVKTTLYHCDTSFKSRSSVSTPSYAATRLSLVAAYPLRSFGSGRAVFRPSIISAFSKNMIAGSLSLHLDESYKFPLILKRYMGGGPRNEEHKERLRAIRKARKIYFDSLPPTPPKPPVCTKHYDEMCKWKTKPISKRIEHRVVHICSFIIHAWLHAYPAGASLRKLQRDIAFRMQRRHRLPGKVPLQIIMTIVGKLERENYLKTKMKSNGHVLIYRDDEENIVPADQVDMRVAARMDDEAYNNSAVALHDVEEEGWLEEDDEAWFENETVVDKKKVKKGVHGNHDEMRVAARADDEVYTHGDVSRSDIDSTYEQPPYVPKFSKQHKPKERKLKKRKGRDESDPVMEWVDVPEGTKYTSRGPRFISQEKVDE
jgi:hypothetical protein